MSDEDILALIDWERETKATLGRYTLVIFPDDRALIRSVIKRTKVNKGIDGRYQSQRLPTIRWHQFFSSSDKAIDFLIERY